MGIQNRKPLIGDYGVNGEGSSDMYSKGANLLNTLRQWVQNDETWRATLRGLNKEFYHQTVTTKQIEEYMAKSTGLKLNAFFDQYLRDSRIPVFEYWIKDEKLIYRWSNCIETFDMPIKIYLDGKEKVLNPTTQQKVETLEKNRTLIKVDPNFYIYTFNVMGN